jgi:hypothetical protein
MLLNTMKISLHNIPTRHPAAAVVLSLGTLCALSSCGGKTHSGEGYCVTADIPAHANISVDKVEKKNSDALPSDAMDRESLAKRREKNI